MKIIKFNSSNLPVFVKQHYKLDDKSTGQQIIGFLCDLGNGSNQFVEDGEWIIENDFGVRSILTNAQYSASFAIKQSIREQIGKDLVNDLFQKLQEQNLSQADEAQIVNKISTCMVALLAGSIKGARVICNALTTDAVFTNQRKTYLLNQIDNAIASM